MDQAGLTLAGEGFASVLLPGADLVGNSINVSGSTNITFRDFTMEGFALQFNGDNSAIAGDGTTANPVYGQMTVQGVLLRNYENQGLGIGATAGNTCQDIKYIDNWFVNCASGASGANVIDTGSSGTKVGYIVSRNHFIFSGVAVNNPGNAVFCGHGVDMDFQITTNDFLECPSNAIFVHQRPFAGENTQLSNFVVANNVIRRSHWSGIAIAGGDSVLVANNTIYDVGLDGTVDEQRSAILVINGISGTSDVAPSGINLIGNKLVGLGSMVYGIMDSHDLGFAASGNIVRNEISGTAPAFISELFLGDRTGGVFQIEHAPFNSGLLAIGQPAAIEALDVFGNVRANTPNSAISLFAELVASSANAAGSFRLAAGLNARFDGTNWVSGTDGGSNGMALTYDYGGGVLRFHVQGSNGGSAQSKSSCLRQCGQDGN